MPITKELIERLREKMRLAQFTVQVIDPPENGVMPTKGQDLRVISIEGDNITVVPVPPASGW